MNITLKQLTVFAAISRTQNLTQAADRLCMTKGALSQSLNELENQLGIKLFERRQARLFINPQGACLLPMVNELLARVEDIGDLFSQENYHQLEIGCTMTIGSFMLADMLQFFEKQHRWLPHVTIANTQHVAAKIKNFELDIGLLEGPTNEPDLISHSWYGDEMVVIASKDHPLAEETMVSFEQLSQERWILRESGSSSRASFDHHLAPYLENPIIPLSLNAFEAILSCVANQLGITFISKLMIQHTLYADYFIELKTRKSFPRQFILCHHRNKYFSPSFMQWIEFCHRWTRKIHSAIRIDEVR